MRWVVDCREGIALVQNHDDRALLQTYLPQSTFVLIPGAGVDCDYFTYHPLEVKQPQIILCPSRMLASKGINELVEAFFLLIKAHPNWSVQLLLVGDIDKKNPQTLSKKKLEQWSQHPQIQWLGHQKDLRSLYEDAYMVVLPSYREGMPKTLLEAGAMGRPIITCDVVGCRDLVVNRYDGVLVKPYDVKDLAWAMEDMITNNEQAITYAKRMHKKIFKIYSNDVVQKQTINLYLDSL